MRNKNCDLFLDIFIKCLATNDLTKKQACIQSEKLLKINWFELYIKCNEKK